MREVGSRGVRVSSAKLLRRLELKRIIAEPPLCERPTLPSRRAWGGPRGYCYVIPLLTCDAFMFEGGSYRFVTEEGQTYLYKLKNGNIHYRR